jgi:hypothetical protein
LQCKLRQTEKKSRRGLASSGPSLFDPQLQTLVSPLTPTIDLFFAFSLFMPGHNSPPLGIKIS